MEISLEDFRRHFALLSDESLLETDREELVEAARTCYDEEVARRGLNEEPVAEEAGEPLAAEAEPAGEHSGDMVSIGSYTFPDEARLAWGLLKGAGIQAFLANESFALGGALHLMVPEEDVETSLQILGGEDLSEEELAVQAEAAEHEEFEEFEEEEPGEQAEEEDPKA